MKLKLFAVISLGTISFLSGCGMNSDFPNNMNQTNYVVTPEQAKVDAKILGALVVLNQNEMAMAQLAQRKASNPSVLNYANLMYQAHSQNLGQVQNLSQRINIAPKQGSTAMMLQRKGKQELAALSRLNAAAFDRAYIATMIKDHAAALQLFNQKLVNEVSNPLLKAHIENTRMHIMNHLKQAEAIQRELTR